MQMRKAKLTWKAKHRDQVFPAAGCSARPTAYLRPTCCSSTCRNRFERIRTVTFGLLFTQKDARRGQRTHFGGKDHQPNSPSLL